jgi:threonine dehydratase
MVAGAARIVEVTEDAAAEAMRVMFATTHNMPEPAGSVALAGLLAERDRQRGRRVAVIHSGGNGDSAMIEGVLAGRTPVAGGSSVAR